MSVGESARLAWLVMGTEENNGGPMLLVPNLTRPPPYLPRSFVEVFLDASRFFFLLLVKLR